MTIIGFHASHEQLSPRELLETVKYAEAVGFGHAMCSDHIAPWSSDQGHSGFAWSWLGAALESTDLELGVVTSPGHRYPVAVLAQASATLAQMYPDRFWCALGSGENLNERVAASGWPEKNVRQKRLADSFDTIRQLHRGAIMDSTEFLPVDQLRLWDVPENAPDLILPALTPETAEELATCADGVITVNQSLDDLEDILTSYRRAGGVGPAMLQVHLSWARDEHEARQLAWDQWRTNVFDPPTMADLATPEDFERKSHDVTLEQVEQAVNVSADLDDHIERLQQYVQLGFDRLYLHHVGKSQRDFIDVFARHVLPAFE